MPGGPDFFSSVTLRISAEWPKSAAPHGKDLCRAQTEKTNQGIPASQPQAGRQSSGDQGAGNKERSNRTCCPMGVALPSLTNAAETQIMEAGLLPGPPFFCSFVACQLLSSWSCCHGVVWTGPDTILSV